MPDRTRPIRKEICLNEQELHLVQHKMRQLGTHNFGAYARKMLIDGYIIKVDYTGQKKLAAATAFISAANQVWFYCITFGAICLADFEGIEIFLLASSFHLAIKKSEYPEGYSVGPSVMIGSGKRRYINDLPAVSKRYLSQIVRARTVTCVITSRRRSEPTMYSRTSSGVSQSFSVSS